MQEWLRVCLILCVFGFFKELRPSEPFIVDYLTGPSQNLTAEEVNQYIFPVATYSNLAHTVVAFLITDFFCYKPIIILCGLAGVTSWSFLTWSTTFTGIVVAHVFFGTFMATEVAYYTYIYAKVDKEHYQKVTSYTRAAVLTGYFSGSVLGQVLMFTEVMESRQLLYISVGTLVTATIWALFLPPVGKSLYFHRSAKQSISQSRRPTTTSNIETVSSTLQKVDFTELVVKVTLKQKITEGMKLFWSHFVSAYTQKEVVHWSLWYSLSMGGYGMVQYYIQLLWDDIQPNLEQNEIWNGAIEAVLTILGAAAAISAGYLKIRALHFRLLTLTVCSLLAGGAIILAVQATTLWVSYVGYISFGILYHFMITYSSYQIAKHLIEDSFGLVFGINTMMALVFQSILTVVVISEEGLHLLPKDQFRVYGGYFIVLSALYFIAAIVSYVRRRREEYESK